MTALLCKDCAYMRLEPALDVLTPSPEAAYFCEADVGDRLSPVTGRMESAADDFCINQRSPNALCGPEGKLFVKREGEE